jgi:hypothetical protein
VYDHNLYWSLLGLFFENLKWFLHVLLNKMGCPSISKIRSFVLKNI